MSDENLDLIERGGSEVDYIQDFDESISSVGIGETDGLLDRALDTAPDRGSRAALGLIEARYDEYLAAHGEVRRLYDGGNYLAAVDVAVNREAAPHGQWIELAELIKRSSSALIDDADRARDFAVVLPILVILAAIGAGVAIVIGLQPRLREFR